MMKFSETLRMALNALRANKLRSVLTLVGIIAGVASIIAVMTALSVLQQTFEKEMSVLGSTTFQVQKWAAGGVSSEEERRKIARRRPINEKHAKAIREKSTLVDLVGSELWAFGFKARFRESETNENLTICGGTPEYGPNNTHFINRGRNLTQEDLRLGRNVVVLGYAVANQLFPYIDPLGKKIKLDGHKYYVVGVMEEKKSALGGNYDNYCLVPITKFRRIYGAKTRWGGDRSVNITVRANNPERVQDAIEEVRGIMRAERGLKPNDEDDFTVFSNASQIKAFNETTLIVKAGALFIGFIALVVAGIGIMNIMLVSVTERTREIGVRKSLGARRKSILNQFLLEAIILCNIGGIIGVLLGFALGNVISIFTGFPASVPLEWTIGGLIFCTIIGMGFGLWPAIVASNKDPIEALRFE
ncbi:MAG: ABC transporter permease [Calditrichia bacterium]